MKTVRFGDTGRRVSVVGLGGEGVLRTRGHGDAAAAVIREAHALGLTYFDSARVYADSERYYGAVRSVDAPERTAFFQTSKSASRDRKSAWADLQQSLERLRTDYLDLWQIHDVRTEEDLAAIAGQGGALEAFLEAKEQGLVHVIGVTGHHDPAVLTRAVQNWPVDAVLLPVNPVERLLGGFLTETRQAARDKGVAVIAMKVLGGSSYLHPGLETTAEQLIRYALSCDIDVAIVGCATPEEVRTLVKAGQAPVLSPEKLAVIEEKFRPYARQLAFYRGS